MGQTKEPRGRRDPRPGVQREGPRCKSDTDLRQKEELREETRRRHFNFSRDPVDGDDPQLSPLPFCPPSFIPFHKTRGCFFVFFFCFFFISFNTNLIFWVWRPANRKQQQQQKRKPKRVKNKKEKKKAPQEVLLPPPPCEFLHTTGPQQVYRMQYTIHDL